MAPRVLHFLIILPFLLSSTSGRELGMHSVPEHVASAMDCWNALNEIRSCGREIAAYFSYGAIDISPQCCGSITIVVRHCWPDLLTALGYTPDQAYILRGYCDAAPVGFEPPLRSPSAHPPMLGPVGSPPVKPPVSMES